MALTDRIVEYKDGNRLFKSLIKFLTKLGVTAANLTVFRIFLGVIFLVLVFYNFQIAGIVLAVAIFLDIFDGALARHKGQASFKGKFFDTLADSIIYSFVLISCLKILGADYYLVYNLFIIPVVYLLAIIKSQEFEKSNWKCGHLKVLVLAPYFLFIYTGIQWIVYGLIISNVFATIMVVYFYLYIHYKGNIKFSSS